jgi:hypothetical protein
VLTRTSPRETTQSAARRQLQLHPSAATEVPLGLTISLTGLAAQHGRPLQVAGAPMGTSNSRPRHEHPPPVAVHDHANSIQRSEFDDLSSEHDTSTKARDVIEREAFERMDVLSWER